MKDSGGETAVPQEVIPQEPQITTTDPAAQEAVQAWQDYSAELEQTVRVLQERENTYQSQIDTANQTIVNLQDQVNGANSTASNTVSSRGGEHEEHEHGEHEGSEDDD
jgi:predicted  nucleic acid-binding Zn-ribbon protein